MLENWSQRNMLDFMIILLSWHTHLLLRKAPTCTLGIQGTVPLLLY